MIHLRDLCNRPFVLAIRRASDENFFSTRQETGLAIRIAYAQQNNPVFDFQLMQIFRKTKAPTFYAASPLIRVRILEDGTLKLGCHEFNQKNTRRILRWAGVKLAKPVKRTVINHETGSVRHER